MPIEITMPQLSDTMTEGTVVKWRKREGEKVKAGEVIAEVETDKAVMEAESFEGGTLAHIAAGEGQKVSVGGLMAVLATAKEDPAAVKKQFAGGAGAKPASVGAAATNGARAAQQPAASSATARAGGARESAAGGGQPHFSANAEAAVAAGATRPSTMTPVMDIESDQEATGTGGSVRDIDCPQNAECPPGQPAHPAHLPDHGHSNGGNGNRRVFASPLARRIAADKGIELSQLRGSGPGGRIIQRDVLAAAEAGPRAAAAPQAQPAQQKGASAAPQRVPSGEKQVIPMTKMRSAIAAALQRSKQQIPHFYETIDIDVEAASALRVRLNEQLKAENVKLSLADFVHKAVCAALLRHPAVNATFDEKKNEITRHGDVHLGIAVAVPDGLIVPVLRNASRMGLRDLRTRSAELIDRARAQRLKQDEGAGGTFTVSSLGTFGVREFSAIINPPQVAILAVGSAEKRAVVDANGQIVARTMMTVTLSADHRVVDGATAAEFLRTLKSMLEEPGMMLV